uniref:FVE n=1 Tax=Rhizophora mucronata TaxID=61149 RepID=A0A2P2KLH8_RHIMU
MTLITGLEPIRASHNMRQESSPTLQNSCALQQSYKFYQK